MDLIIADMPDGLPVPHLDLPAGVVPSWNLLTEEWIEPIFEMARNTLNDDGAVLVFHPNIPSVRVSTDSFAELYGFKCYQY